MVLRRKENYPMRKLDVPKRVTLPNGRTFVARYERIKRSELPPNIRMRRTYRQRAAPRNRRRRVQRGRGIGSFINKLRKNPIVKAIAGKGLEYAPGIYKNVTKRIKNKRAQKILNSDFASLGLNQAIKAGRKFLDIPDKKPVSRPRRKLIAKPPQIPLD